MHSAVAHQQQCHCGLDRLLLGQAPSGAGSLSLESQQLATLCQLICQLLQVCARLQWALCRSQLSCSTGSLHATVQVQRALACVLLLLPGLTSPAPGGRVCSGKEGRLHSTVLGAALSAFQLHSGVSTAAHQRSGRAAGFAAALALPGDLPAVQGNGSTSSRALKKASSKSSSNPSCW